MIRIGTCRALQGRYPGALDLVVEPGGTIPERLGPAAKVVLGADPGGRVRWSGPSTWELAEALHDGWSVITGGPVTEAAVAAIVQGRHGARLHQETRERVRIFGCHG